MKKLMVIMAAAVMVFSLAFAATAEETESISYDLGTEGIIDFPELPESYKENAEHPGTVTRVTYDNGIDEKYFNIYLPFGYEDSTDSYNVLYLAHGGGGCDPDTFLSPDRATAIQKVIDHMFEDGICDPFIITAVSWKPVGADTEAGDTKEMEYTVEFSQDELSRCIVPYIDENYRTNEGREHRAFGGYSMGGCTTWNVLMHDLKDFATLIPLSGAAWAIEKTGEISEPEATASAIAAAIADQKMTADDFRIFSATGSIDFALESLGPQMEAMRKNEMFKFGENTFFGVMEGIPHGDPFARLYLYTIMPMVW